LNIGLSLTVAQPRLQLFDDLLIDVIKGGLGWFCLTAVLDLLHGAK
jgi:hypothetical protein